jgi:glucan phosphorylase
MSDKIPTTVISYAITRCLWKMPASASDLKRSPAHCDLLTQRWLLTQETHDKENPKRVYYLSMEFLIGRTLVNNIINLGVEKFVRDDFQSDRARIGRK